MSLDIVKATVDLLIADSPIFTRTGSDIFGGEFPKRRFKAMPKDAVMVRRIPGGAGTQSDYMETEIQDIEVYTYGKTPFSADSLYRLVRPKLKQFRRSVVSGVLIHWFNPTGSAESEADPETKWSFVRSVWSIMASETAVS